MEILIEDIKYEILDVLSGITIVNTSVCRKHKVSGSHGERKIYLPGNIDEKLDFFENFEGEIRGFVWTENLLEYLDKAKKEYYYPTQEYRDKETMRTEHNTLKNSLKEREAVLHFRVKKSEVTHTGLYINQASGRRIDKNWNLITDIALPNISRLSILKLKQIGSSDFQYYFKLNLGATELVEMQEKEAEDRVQQRIEDSRLGETEKETVIKARVGQGKYRKRLLKEISYCPFTLVDDEHLLIASHIKPWKDSTNPEKKDPKNGFIFTPTFDKLFDRGYISFEDDKALMISPWLSKYNQNKLGLVAGTIISHLPNLEGKRKVFLEYHRKFVFKKLEDL